MEEKKNIFKNRTLMEVIGTTLIVTGVGAAAFLVGRKVGHKDWQKLLTELEKLKCIPDYQEVLIAIENNSEISEKTLNECTKLLP